MVLSHTYKYLFIELPHTASTAISRELCENYDGLSILSKHAHYHEFLRLASDEKKTHFVFAGVRNPLDVVVTLYFKQKTNHQGFFTDPKYWQKNGGHVSQADLLKFNFIRSNNADFVTYFRRFYRIAYDSWGTPSPKEFDYVIRYENLQDDFRQVLELLRIKQVRPLPIVNKTSEKEYDFWSYYTPEIHEQAIRVFGPYMKKWAYDFPAEWGDNRVPWSSQTQFYILRMIRKHLLGGPSFYAHLFRKLRHRWHGYLYEVG
jgi:hypothetical protein